MKYFYCIIILLFNIVPLKGKSLISYTREYHLYYSFRVFYNQNDNSFGDLYKIDDPAFWNDNKWLKYKGDDTFNYLFYRNFIRWNMGSKLYCELGWEYQPSQSIDILHQEKRNQFYINLKYKTSRHMKFSIKYNEAKRLVYGNSPDWYYFYNTDTLERDYQIYNNSFLVINNYLSISYKYETKNTIINPTIIVGDYRQYYYLIDNIDDSWMWTRKNEDAFIKKGFMKFNLNSKFTLSKLSLYLYASIIPNTTMLGNQWSPYESKYFKCDLYYKINKKIDYVIGYDINVRNYSIDNPYNPRPWQQWLEEPKLEDEYKIYRAEKEYNGYRVWTGVNVKLY